MKQPHHLKDKIKLGKDSSQKLIAGIFIVIALIAFFALMLLSHHSTKKQNRNKASTANANINPALNAQSQRLLELESKHYQIPKVIEKKPKQPSKQLIERENAPTQMYAATPKTQPRQADHSPSSNNPYSRFANQSQQNTTIKATKLRHPNFTILQGEMIQATLATAINSDLPGMVSAVISQPVYSYLGENLLVPAGSRVIGRYASIAGNGAATARVFIIWDRIITPNGNSILINSEGSDALGRAGVAANSINDHFFKIFGTASLLSLLSAGSATVGVSSSQQANSANQFQQSIANAFQQSAQNTLGANLSIKPTLMIHQGDAVTIFVAHDLDFYSLYHNQS